MPVRRLGGYRGPDRRGTTAATGGGYRGPDRRLPTVSAATPARVRAVAVAAILVGLIVALGATTAMSSLAAFVILRNASDVLLLLAGALELLVWRLSGRASSALTGAALLVIGCLMIPLQAIGLLLHRDLPLQRVSPECVLVLGATGAYLCLRSTASRSVVADLRPMREAGAMTGASLAALVTMGVIRAMGGPLDAIWPWTAALSLTAAAWFVAALSYVRPRAGDLRPQRGMALAVVGLAAADALLAGGLDGHLTVAGAGAAVRALAGVVALLVAAAELRSNLSRQGNRALWLAGELGDTVSALAHEQVARRKLLHDARGTIAAIRLANGTLTKYQQQLDEMLQQDLRESVDSELSRLEAMLSHDHGQERVEFDLADILEPVVRVVRDAGLDVRFDLAGAPRVFGRPSDTSTVLHNLLTNAAQYAGEGPVELTVRAQPDAVQVLVSDRGPGVDLAEREAIFGRGVRGAAAAGRDGSGLGLFIARWLLDEQEGALHVEDRPGGGAIFVVTLPRMRPEASQGQELSEAGRPG